MVLSLALFGCGEPPVAPVSPAPSEPAPQKRPLVAANPEFVFTELAWDDAFLTNTGPTTSPSALIDGVLHEIDYHVLARAGDAIGDQVFGRVHDLAGDPLELCNQQDFDTMFEARGEMWLTSHFECAPGAIYLSKLASDTEGKLSIASTAPVDFTAHNGLFNPCAGQITPWGTHLASEEYEPDATEEPTSVEEHGWDYLSWSSMERAAAGKTLRPYDYGWTPEIAVMTAAGDTLTVKHKAMGRFSHEIAYVLPDERTVYLSDDGRAGGMFLFVADKPAELSSGTLYAMRWRQESAERGGVGKAEWVSLGHSTDAFIDAAIDAGVTFADLFDRQEPVDGACAQPYRLVDQDGRAECLKVADPSERFPNPALLASRLETRRYAGLMGATTEFEKGEGIAFHPARKALYVAFAKIGGRMVEEEGRDASLDHVRLPENPCGAIWTGTVASDVNDVNGQPIDSASVLTDFRSLLAGRAIEPDEHGNTCLASGPANPDNIAVLPHYDLLMIAEDTKRHTVANLWALSLHQSRLRRAMVAPRHAEITGISWVPDLGGFGYLTVAVQHPWMVESLEGEGDLPEGITAADQRSWTGYIGPFPRLTGE
jgi:hypothetical protein